jgi:hypothetical protein
MATLIRWISVRRFRASWPAFVSNVSRRGRCLWAPRLGEAGRQPARQSSIEDQVASCRSFLASSLPKGYEPQQVSVEVITESEVSGEIADRAGINQVWAGIEAKRWDVIIAEESSRLYRHHGRSKTVFLCR